jgi:indolepyruvate ferredoxin oxidoreductase
MAAHLEGRGASVLDFMGFAQKGGQVLSFVRLARTPADLNQVRIDRGGADALLACDLVVAGSREALGTLAHGRTRVVANQREIPTGAMLRDPAARIDTRALERLLVRRVGEGAYRGLDAQAMAERLVGDAQPANVLLLGFAWQEGLVPVSLEALERAIELNGVAVEMNRRAFAWGRLLAADPDVVAAHLPEAALPPVARTLEEIVARRAAFLADYQDEAYAARYRARIEAVAAAERHAYGEGATALAEAAARGLFKLMAYKDEYEVARLHTEGSFLARLKRDFQDGARLSFHLAPPLIARAGPDGRPRKMRFGPWILPVFRGLARLKRLRGTALDPFGYTHERREERALIGEYEGLIETAIARMGVARPEDLAELLGLPEAIRGYGPVKAEALARARARRDEILARIAAARPDVSVIVERLPDVSRRRA